MKKRTRLRLNNKYWACVHYDLVQVDYPVGSDTGTATLKITTPNMDEIFAEAFTVYYVDGNLSKAPDELKDLFERKVLEYLTGDYTPLETMVTLNVIKDKNYFKLIPNEEWQKAATSNSEAIFSKYYDLYLQELINVFGEGE